MTPLEYRIVLWLIMAGVWGTLGLSYWFGLELLRHLRALRAEIIAHGRLTPKGIPAQGGPRPRN